MFVFTFLYLYIWLNINLIIYVFAFFTWVVTSWKPCLYHTLLMILCKSMLESFSFRPWALDLLPVKCSYVMVNCSFSLALCTDNKWFFTIYYVLVGYENLGIPLSDTGKSMVKKKPEGHWLIVKLLLSLWLLYKNYINYCLCMAISANIGLYIIDYYLIGFQLTSRTIQYQLSYLYIWLRSDASLQLGWILGQNGKIASFITTIWRFGVAVPYSSSCLQFRWLLCNNLSTDCLHNHVVNYVMAVHNPTVITCQYIVFDWDFILGW